MSEPLLRERLETIREHLDTWRGDDNSMGSAERHAAAALTGLEACEWAWRTDKQGTKTWYRLVPDVRSPEPPA